MQLGAVLEESVVVDDGVVAKVHGIQLLAQGTAVEEEVAWMN